MEAKTTYEVELELAMDEDEDKTPKDICVEGCMAQVTDALTGKNFRRMLGAIEGQIRAAYNAGYNVGYLDGKTASRKEERGEELATDFWSMMRTVAEYDCEELDDAFHTGEFLSDAIEKYTLEEFHKLFLEHEKAKKDIQIGDEVEWTRWSGDFGPKGTIGWVTGFVSPEPGTRTILVVFDPGDGKEYAIAKEFCTKTGKHSELFSKKNK